MTIDEIKAKADSFFEFPTENRDHVTTTSAILFARHILEFADCSADCHQFHDSISEYRQVIAREIMQLVADRLYNGAHIGMAAVIKSEFNLSD